MKRIDFRLAAYVVVVSSMIYGFFTAQVVLETLDDQAFALCVKSEESRAALREQNTRIAALGTALIQASERTPEEKAARIAQFKRFEQESNARIAPRECKHASK